MKEHKYTPGPWREYREGSSTIYIEAKLRDGVIQEVAACGPTEAGSEQQSANASLISAAPALLKELIKARKIIEESDEWWMDSPDRGGFDTEAIDAAINKALGGE